MSRTKKAKHAFRPTMNQKTLEERVVMSASASADLIFTRPPVAMGAVNVRSFNSPQIAQAYRVQFRQASQALRRAIRMEANQLLANGTPDQQAIENFNASVQGAINATALRVASQASLLPNASNRILPQLERALLGNGPNSLTTQLQQITSQDVNRFPRPDVVVRGGAQARAVANTPDAVNTPGGLNRFPRPNIVVRNLQRSVNQVLNNQANNVANFVSSGTAQRLSTNSFNQRIPLRRFMAGSALNQFGNTLASLSNGFQNVANTSLFADGTTVTPDRLAPFLNQGTQALGTALFQLGSAFSLFPNANTTLFPQLQNAIFGNGTLQPFTTTTTLSPTGTLTGTGDGTGVITTSPISGTGTLTGTGTGLGNISPAFSNFLNGFQSLPTNSTAFGPAVSSLFNSGFQNIAGNLGSFLGLPQNGTLSLPTQATGIFGNLGSSFGGGFNNGFGSGVIGFGTPGTGFNNAFMTGFNNTIGLTNPGFGFNVPTSIFNPTFLGGTTGTISGTGTLTGTGDGTGVGVGSPLNGTGTLTGGGLGGGLGGGF